MKTKISILFLFLIMLPMLLKLSILIDFKINQDYISKVLCIKKEIQDNKCQGNCHLNKQLQKTEEASTSGDLPKALSSKLKVETIFIENDRKTVLEGKQISNHFEYQSFYIAPNISGLKPPPKFHS